MGWLYKLPPPCPAALSLTTSVFAPLSPPFATPAPPTLLSGTVRTVFVTSDTFICWDREYNSLCCRICRIHNLLYWAWVIKWIVHYPIDLKVMLEFLSCNNLHWAQTNISCAMKFVMRHNWCHQKSVVFVVVMPPQRCVCCYATTAWTLKLGGGGGGQLNCSPLHSSVRCLCLLIVCCYATIAWTPELEAWRAN